MKNANLFSPKERKKLLKALYQEMSDCAEHLEYEQAAALRDQIREIEAQYGKWFLENYNICRLKTYFSIKIGILLK